MNTQLYFRLCSQFEITDYDKLSEILECYAIKKKHNDFDLENAIHNFLISKTPEGLSDITISNYKNSLEVFNKFVGGRDISRNLIKEYVISMSGKKSSTKSQIIQRLRVFFNWCFREELIDYNVMSDVTYKTSKTFRHAIPKSDMLKINQSVSDSVTDEALVRFLVTTGCRVSEVCNIKKEDINFDKNFVTVIGKGSKERTVLFDSSTKKLLRKQINLSKGDYLFSSKRYPYGKLQRFALEKRVRNIGINSNLTYNLHPHLFRHSFATDCLENGMDLISIKTLLGHSDLSATQVYAESSLRNIKNQYSKIFK